MNKIKNIISFNEISTIGFSECFRMSCSPIEKCNFSKVDQLLTNWFFGSYKLMNIRKYIAQTFGRNSPDNFGITVPFLWSKGKGSTKFTHQKGETGQFCVSERKRSFVDKIITSFRFVSINTKTTLSINKTGQVRKIIAIYSFGILNRLRKIKSSLETKLVECFSIFIFLMRRSLVFLQLVSINWI